MKPVKISHDPQGDLFKTEIDLNHPLVRLGREVDWSRLDELFGQTYCDDNGRPATSTRLLVALHYLKYTFNLSDADVVAAWVENPYWQQFSGNQYFEHTPPVDPSVMSRFRKRIGESGAEELLKETLEAGQAQGHQAASAQPCECGHDGSGEGNPLSDRCAALQPLA